MPYNHKIHIAQQTQQEAQEELKQMGGDVGKELAGAFGSELAATGLVAAAAPAAIGAISNPAIGKGIATFVGVKGALALGEELQGAKKIFNDYYLDYTRLLDALSKTFPNNSELQQVVNLGKSYGQKAQQAMNQAQIQDPNVIQALQTGLNTGMETASSIGNVVSTAMGGNQQPPASAASAATNASFNYKNYRLAIVGNYGNNALKYLNEGGTAALAGLATAGPWGALIGGVGSLGWEIGKDVFHNMQSKAYQAAAYTNELKTKGMSMVAQLKKFNPLMALQMYKVIQQIDAYVQFNIYGNKKAKVSQEFMSSLNPEQQKAMLEQFGVPQQGQEQGQEQAQNDPTQDPELQEGVQVALQAYNYAQSLVGQPGVDQQYQLYKNEYNVILQQLNQYIQSNHPNYNPDEVIARMMGVG
jgi:hypothetical protein